MKKRGISFESNLQFKITVIREWEGRKEDRLSVVLLFLRSQVSLLHLLPDFIYTCHVIPSLQTFLLHTYVCALY